MNSIPRDVVACAVWGDAGSRFVGLTVRRDLNIRYDMAAVLIFFCISLNQSSSIPARRLGQLPAGHSTFPIFFFLPGTQFPGPRRFYPTRKNSKVNSGILLDDHMGISCGCVCQVIPPVSAPLITGADQSFSDILIAVFG